MRQASWLGLRVSTILWLGAVVLLAALTLVLFAELRRFNLADPPWPYDPSFTEIGQDGASGWRIMGDPSAVRVEAGSLRLRNDDPERTVEVRRTWPLAPDGPHAFRVAATIRAVGIRGGRGEVSFAPDHVINRNGLTTIHHLAVLRGNRATARYVSRFEVSSGSREVTLAIRLHHATGELTVSGLEIKALTERWLVRTGRPLLQAGWAMVLLAGCALFWRGIDNPSVAVLLASAAAGGLVLLLLPEGARNAIVEPLADMMPRHLLDSQQLADLGHFVIFAAAGFLVRLSRRRDAAWRQLLLLFVLAGLAELLQFLAELRSPTWGDGLTNAAGALAGWLPAMLWLRLQEGQFATQRRSSSTLPPQAAKQRR